VPRDVALSTEARGALSVHPVLSVRPFGVDAFVTDRFGGVSEGHYASLNLGDHVGDEIEHVEENRRRVAEALGTERLVIVRQVHASALQDAALATRSSEADILATTCADLALAILVADCVPILLVDAASARFALVHAGWRGLADRVVAHAVAIFAHAEDVHVFVGPSISAEGYQVGPEVARRFAVYDDAVLDDVDDRSRLDLRVVVTQQLLEAGVLDEHVVRSRDVTDGGEVFFSDRAQRPCGRFALVAKRGLVA
jgi:YfiH family protein